MAVDPKIREAIENTVTEEGQPDGLARKLVRWFEAIATGNEDIQDKQSANRHLELLYSEVQTDVKAIEDQLEEIAAELSDDEEDS